MRNQNRTMAQQLAGQHTIVEMYKASGVPVERGSLMAAFGCNFEGDMPVTRVVSLVGQILDVAKEHGVTLTYVTLADTMAWATPLAIKRAGRRAARALARPRHRAAPARHPRHGRSPTPMPAWKWA